MNSFTIKEDLGIQSTAAVEVDVEMDDGTRRWYFFMTPGALATCGDWIPGTKIPIHYGAPHLIIIGGTFEEAVIRVALLHIEEAKQLEACTVPLNRTS